MRFDTKIAIVLRDDLENWQELNVTAFLASGVAANPELLGEPYTDADGTLYTPAETALGDRAVAGRRVARGLPMAVFTAELFGTGHDEANRAAVAAVPRSGLDLVGIAVHGPRNAVDKVVKGAELHR